MAVQYDRHPLVKDRVDRVVDLAKEAGMNTTLFVMRRNTRTGSSIFVEIGEKGNSVRMSILPKDCDFRRIAPTERAIRHHLEKVRGLKSRE